MDWNKYYSDQAGGTNYNVYKGSLYQKGYGLGGMSRRFFNWVIPLFKKNILPSLQSGAKALGKEAISSVSDISQSVLAGTDFKTASDERINKAISNLKEKVESKLEGNGIKRNNKSRKYKTVFKKQNFKKTRFDDIFS